MGFTVKTIHRNDLANPVAESAAIAYQFRKVMNTCSEAVVTLNDAAYAMSQKYDTHEAAATYLGGRVQIEDPTNTKIFDGTIVRIQGDPAAGVIRLFCRDWLHQLDREHIDFDTREDLDGAGLRESYAQGDVDVHEGTGADAAKNRCAYNLGGVYFVVDDNMNWANDQFNGKYLLISNKNSGTLTTHCGPFTEYTTPDDAAMVTDTPAKGQTNVWVDDDNAHQVENNDGFYVEYQFYIGGEDSDLVDEVKEIRLTWTWTRTEDVQDDLGTILLQYYDWTAADYKDVWATPYRPAGDQMPGRETYRMVLTPWWDTDMFNAGRCYVRFYFFHNNGGGANNVGAYFYYLRLETDITGAPDNTAYLIDDTTATNKLQTHEDLSCTAGGAGVYEGVKYAIAGVITTHFDALIGAYDTDVALDYATDVTASTDVVGHHFDLMTPLEILRRLADMDGTDFWLDDDLDLHWNDSYALNGEPTWTDSTVLTWNQPRLTLEGLHNKIIVRGMTSGESQASDEDSDAASIGYYGTYTYVVENPAIYTEKEASDLAAYLETRYKEARYRVDATLNGLTTNYVGQVININSTNLDIANTKYVITELNYHSDHGVTHCRLVPRATILNVEKVFQDTLFHIKRRLDHLERHIDFSASHTETWS